MILRVRSKLGFIVQRNWKNSLKDFTKPNQVVKVVGDVVSTRKGY
jgi:hypothetical protein